MARHRTLVRLARALRALTVAAVAVAGTTALFEADLGRALVMPSWKVATAPPVLYLTIALLVFRHLPLDRRVGWALAACSVNVSLALASAVALSLVHPMSMEGALLRALWTYVPSPLIHLVAAPLVLLSWRSRVVPVRTSRSGRAGDVRPAGSGMSNWDAVLRPSLQPAWVGSGPTLMERAGPARDKKVEPRVDDRPPPPPIVVDEHVEPDPRPAVSIALPPLTMTPAVQAPPAAAPAVEDEWAADEGPAADEELATEEPAVVEEAPAAERRPPAAPPIPDEPVVRVPFARIATQLPPEAFLLPWERLAESMPHPHVLLVPQRLVIPQLAEGAVEVAWTLIEDQFPDLALAAPRAELRKRFPGWVLSLPLDEVVRQLPRELLRVEAAAADVSAIEQFPPPFAPGPPAPEPSEASQLAPAAPPSSDSAVTRPVDPVSADRGAEASDDERAESVAVAPLLSAAPPAQPVARPAVTAGAPAAATLTAPAAPARAAELAPSIAAEAVDEEAEALARALALGLAPLGAFDWQTRRVAGRPLVSFVAPTLTREAVDTLAARAAALLVRLTPWGVEQLTIRTSRVACVLAPLGRRGCVAATIRRNGPVAMLELLLLRAARATGAAPATPGAGGVTAVTTLTRGNGHRRLGEATRALTAFGPVAASVAEADGTAPSVYVFARRDEAVLAGVARVVHEALVDGHDPETLGRLESFELQRGRELAIVRPLRGPQVGAGAVLAAAGEVALAGRAHRAVARAAALLEAR
jgi:hypothetical protein